MYFQLYLHNLVEQFNKDTFVFNTRGGFRGGTGGARPVFLQSLVFCDHFEELQTVLIEVKLINNNAILRYCLPKYYQNIFHTQSFVVWQTVIMLFYHNIGCS